MSTGLNITDSYISQMYRQIGQRRKEYTFKQADTDSSGGLDQTEFSQFIAQANAMTGGSIDATTAFSKYDTNQDGSINSNELGKFSRDNPATQVTSLTGSLSGLLGSAAAQTSDNIFGKMDTNGDGTIAKTELANYLSNYINPQLNTQGVSAAYGALNKSEIMRSAGSVSLSA